MDLVVGEGNMVLVDCVPGSILLRLLRAQVYVGAPFLELDLGVVCAGLGGDELLEIAYGVVWAALDSDWMEPRLVGGRLGERIVNLCGLDDRLR